MFSGGQKSNIYGTLKNRFMFFKASDNSRMIHSKSDARLLLSALGLRGPLCACLKDQRSLMMQLQSHIPEDVRGENVR